MKKMRKVLALVIALTFLFSVVAPVGGAFAADSKSDQQNAGSRLQQLGIIVGTTDGNLELDKTLTRAEVTVLLARLYGMGDSADLLKNTPSKFSDVKAGEWYTGWINLASSQGWVKGDPQGTFRPNEPVQYREAITMVVKLLGYNDNLPGAWPTSYMAKAANLGLTKGLSYSDAKSSAVRGDIFLAASRALDKNIVYWDKDSDDFLYKQNKTNKDSNITLLEDALDLVKYEDMVVSEISMVSSSLKDNEVKLVNKDKGAGAGTYTLTVGNPLDYFGKEVTAWVDDNDYEILAIQVETSDSDIYVDTLTDDTNKDEVNLDVADKTIDIANNAKVYVNGKSVDSKKLDDYVGAYGRFVLNDDGDLAYAMLFDFDGDKGVVTKVDDKVITYVDDRASKDNNELDIEDYDDGYYVFDKDLNQIKLSDIANSSAIFYGEHQDDDTVYVLVSDATISGELERLSDTKAKISGTTYDIADPAMYTDNSGKDYNLYKLDDADGMIGEEVEAVLNLSGDILLLSGSSNDTSGTLYGVVTYAEKSGSSKVTIFNKEGKEVEYKFADRNDLDGSIVHVNNSFDYYEDGDDLSYALIKYKLDKAGEIYGDFDNTDEGIIVEVKGATNNLNSDVIHIFGTAADYTSGLATKDSDKDFVNVEDDKYYFDKDTVIMTSIDDGELDPSNMSYDTLYNNAISDSDNGYAVIFGTPGKTADAIFFIDGGFDGADDDYFYGILDSNPVKDGDDWYADINIAGEGIKEVKLDSKDNLFEGSLIGYKLNNSDAAKVEATYNANKNKEVSGSAKAGIVKHSSDKFFKVEDVDGYSIKVNGSYYKVDSDVVVYALDKDDAYSVDKKSSYSKVHENDGVVLLTNEDGKVAAILLVEDLYKDGNPSPNPINTDGVVTYIDTDDQAGSRVMEIETADGSVVEYSFTSAINAFIDTSADTLALIEDSAVVVTTNTAGDTVTGFEYIGLDGAYVGITIPNNSAFNGVEIVGADGTIVSGTMTIEADDVRIENVIFNNLTIDGDNFESKENTINGTLTVTGDDAEFNTTINGNVVVNGSATFTNVTFDATKGISGTGTVTIAGTSANLVPASITVATLVATNATDDAVKTQADAIQDAKDLGAAADQAAADVIDIEIEALPAVADVELTDEPAVDGARTSYDTATAAVKELVKAANVTKLEALEAEIADLTAAEAEEAAVIAAIAAVGAGDTIALADALDNENIENVITANMAAYLAAKSTLDTDYATVNAAIIVVNEEVAAAAAEAAVIAEIAAADGTLALSEALDNENIDNVIAANMVAYFAVKSDLINDYATVNAEINQVNVNEVAGAIPATFTASGEVNDVVMPAVPTGYTIEVKTSATDTNYDTDGKLLIAGDSVVVYTVTHVASTKTADTGNVTVTVVIE